MKRQILLIFLVVCFVSKTQGQNFEVTVDTINISILDLMRRGTDIHLTHAIKFDQKYYVYFYEYFAVGMGSSKNHFFEISENGNIKTLNDVRNSFYDDFFVKDNRIYLKAYWGGYSYYFNVKKEKWVKIKKLDDVIFEDEKFYVTYLDFGEWGSATWFRDKKTGIEYEVEGFTKINKVNDIYYLTSSTQVLAIKDPLKLMKCDKKKYYNKMKGNKLSIVKKEIKENGESYIVGVALGNSESLIGTEIVYQDTTYSRWSFEPPNIAIARSFVFNNQLFHLCTDSNYTFIAKIEDGKMIPVQIIGDKVRLSLSDNNHRGKSSNDDGLFRKFRTEDRNLFGFIEIYGNKIKMRYLKIVPICK